MHLNHPNLEPRQRPACQRLLTLASLVLACALPGLPVAAQDNTGTPAAGKNLPVNLPVVAHLDLQRYSGTWHEIARLPNSFQKKCAGGDVSAQYTPLPTGEVSVVNRCRLADGSLSEAEGIARRVAPRQGEAPDVGRLQVRFAPSWLSWLPMVWGDYWVMDIAEDYSTVLVGTPDRRYLWLLSRQPALPAEQVQAWLNKARAQGFDTQAVTLTPATPKP